MEEQMLKTSWKQRILIAVVAAIMLGSTIAVYVAIVISGKASSNSSTTNQTVAQLQAKYEAKSAEYEKAATEQSAIYFDEFNSYRSNVKAYNETTANSEGVTSTDLKIGEGTEITAESSDYAAYYIGYCADESVFDSSFDNYEEPTALKAPLFVEPNYLIEGWYLGVAGMHTGGVREITIPGQLAYGDTTEICGGTNKPLKFIIMAVDKTEPLATLSTEMEDLYNQLIYASYAAQNTSTATPTDDETAPSDTEESVDDAE